MTKGAARTTRSLVFPLLALVILVGLLSIGLVANRIAGEVPARSLVSQGETLFGTTLRPQPGPPTRKPLTQAESRLGRPQVLRLYNDGLPEAWASTAIRAGSTPLVVSFKADPAAVLRGQYDVALTHWFATAPRDRATYWAYFHEPEDQVEAGAFSAQTFRQAWQHVAQLAAMVDNPKLYSTVILMCWTTNPASGRDWRDYVTPGTLDVLAWDCYNHGARRGFYQSADTMLARAVEASHEASAGWGVAELGSLLAVGDDGKGRADWLLELGDYARGNGAAFVTYFDSSVGGDYELADSPSRNALRDLLTSAPLSPQVDPSVFGMG